MTLNIGSRVGSYEILSAIGAGGMGEVYRARDTRLGRDVAIKILPGAFMADPDRRARFEREARVLASLNHPHIAAIYGVVDAGELPALVLELVDGQTLAERIATGRVPVAEAIGIAAQIAEALEAAHARGIVHRDLKPANVKITPESRVKALDFGLAKAFSDREPEDLSQSPTVTVAATAHGVVLGTAAYMSPEQARGKPVDKRTDVWAFGCVLFEMLGGRPPFGHETLAETMAAILEREPSWKSLPPSTPSGIRRLLERCLEKDVDKRLRDLGDARIELDESRAGRRSPARSGFDRRVATSVAATALIAMAAAYLWRTDANERSPGQATSALRFSQVTAESGIEWFPSLSPDGQWVAYAGDSSGNRDIYLQSIGGKTPINLTADSQDDDDQPAFSRDGERLAFRSEREGGGIFVMGRTGESIRRLTRAGFNPSWSPDGAALVYATQNVEINPQNTQGTSELWRVAVPSGELTRLDTGDAAMPSWSPHGHRIAYMRRLGDTRQRDIWTTSTTANESAPVTNDTANDWSPVWSPDGRYLYFASDRGGSMNLWRVPIDERTGKTAVGPEALTTPAPFLAHPTISGDGLHLAYSAVHQTRNVQRLPLDPATGTPSGAPSWVTTGSRLWANPDPSPDGQWVAFYSSPPEEKIHVARSDGRGLRQLTTDQAIIDRVPRWSPDGKWIAFFSNRSGRYQIWKIRPDGSELQQLTDASDDVRYPIWSPDGSRMAVTVIGKTAEAGQVFIFDPNLPWTKHRPEPLPLLETPRTLFLVNSWSANGERLVGQAGLVSQGIVAYTLRSRTFDRLTDFGEYPVWLADGNHALFVARGKELFVVDARSKAVNRVFGEKRDVIGPPQLSRDGREAYYSRRVTEADIWFLTIGGVPADSSGK